jgi:AAA+ superfamily predicted ATPase
VEPPRGVLLHGPPGCGKTALANAIANDAGVPFLRVAAPEVVSGMSGESEAKLRALFQVRFGCVWVCVCVCGVCVGGGGGAGGAGGGGGGGE